tara:strand:+ start:3268 stop:4665 length:1398 start_codon:yes stop_codon:yes gene_type:complete
MPERTRSRDFTDASRGERLQRVLADAGVGSRRACEELILAGEVEVNGVLVTALPAWVDPEEDRIVVEGRPIPRPERKLYVLLNKPVRTLSTAKDEPGADRRTVTDLVDHPGAARLFPVGRLDYDTVGLILLTNDGELANRLTHPRYGVPKTYKVLVKGVLGQEAVAELEQGIYLAERKAGHTVGGVRTARVEITVLQQSREGTTLEMTLREGRNRQVRRMLAAVGYPVRKLERIGMGPIRLKGVARGAWRELTRDEVWALRRAAADERPDAETDGSGASSGGKARYGEQGGRGSGAKPAKDAAQRTGKKTVQKASKKTGKKAGGRGSAYEPAPLNPGTPIKRRMMKNAINRASVDPQPKGKGPRSSGADPAEGAPAEAPAPNAKPNSKPTPKAKPAPKGKPEPKGKPGAGAKRGADARSEPERGPKPTRRTGSGPGGARGGADRRDGGRGGPRGGRGGGRGKGSG